MESSGRIEKNPTDALYLRMVLQTIKFTLCSGCAVDMQDAGIAENTEECWVAQNIG